MRNCRILIVEDEPSIADNVMICLGREGFATEWSATLSDARKAFSNQDFHFIILDVGLPDGSGFDFCREIRSESNVPIVMLTARDDEIDRIVGLEIGADDYVTKPFSPRELAARVRAVLRRSQTSLNIGEKKAEKSALIQINEDTFEVFVKGELLNLSPHEFRLLKVLNASPGRVFSRSQLLEKAWKEPLAAMERTVDAHIKGLRAKIKKASGRDLIVTHRGFGYSLDPEA